MSLSVSTSGDSATVTWSETNDPVANLTRRKTKFKHIIMAPASSGIIVIVGDPSTHYQAKITVITMFVAPTTDTLSVSSVALVLEEILGYSSSNPLICALVITGAHSDVILDYIKKLGYNCLRNIYFMRGPRASYTYRETEAALVSVTQDLQKSLGIPLEITWNITSGCNL